MFSACEEAERHNLSPAGTTTAECLTALQAALSSNATLSSQFPFNVPPLVDPAVLNASSHPDVTCLAGEALSPRFGGECISCDNGVVHVSSSGW
jgi:hypothetical protein